MSFAYCFQAKKDEKHLDSSPESSRPVSTQQRKERKCNAAVYARYHTYSVIFTVSKGAVTFSFVTKSFVTFCLSTDSYAYIKIASQVNDSELRFEVSDNGKGIDKVHGNKIFNLFNLEVLIMDKKRLLEHK